MRTRTLLLLAVVCGLAILVAGGIHLLRISGGESADADDLAIGGVDDPTGTDGFTLVVSGDVLRPLAPGDGDCAGITVETATCDLRFDTSDVEGHTRILLLRRGEDQRRWALA